MRSGIFATAILAAVSAASAATVEKRQSDNSTEVAAPATALTDGDILNLYGTQLLSQNGHPRR